MDSTFLGYMQEQEEREEIIRKMMRAYRRGAKQCKFSADNYFSPSDLEEMKQEAIRRVDRERY